MRAGTCSSAGPALPCETEYGPRHRNRLRAYGHQDLHVPSNAEAIRQRSLGAETGVNAGRSYDLHPAVFRKDDDGTIRTRLTELAPMDVLPQQRRAVGRVHPPGLSAIQPLPKLRLE